MQIKMSHHKLKNQGKISPTVVLSIAVILAVGLGLWWHFGHNHKKPASDVTTPPAQSQNNNSATGSPNVKQQTESNSGSSASSGSSSSTSNSSPSPSSTTNKTKVTPYITTAGPVSPQNGKIVIRGSIQGVVESSGTCKLTLTKGSQTVTQTASSFFEGQETTCSQLVFTYGSSSGDVNSGTWQAVLSYSSPDAYGTSSPTNLTIQ